jgi:hypothetical protein
MPVDAEKIEVAGFPTEIAERSLGSHGMKRRGAGRYAGSDAARASVH